MGRFESLNPETKDLVNCLIPAVAAQFKISDPLGLIPEDIRMRAWDCERRDHIKDKTEDDPRNWGVQFLKDLMAIARLKSGNLQEFHTDLRAKVANHEEKHPWVRLADIKELKEEYENPGAKEALKTVEESSSDSSTDSYLEELVEPELPKGMKRGRRNHELYEARIQESAKRRKRKAQGRLRRTETGEYHRKEKRSRRSLSQSLSQSHGNIPLNTAYAYGGDAPSQLAQRQSAGLSRDGSVDSVGMMSNLQAPTPSFAMSSEQPPARSLIAESINSSTEPLAVQKLQAELEVAESELKTARLKYAYIEAKERAEGGNRQGKLDEEDSKVTY